MSDTLQKLKDMLDAEGRVDHEASKFVSHRPEFERHLKHVSKIECNDGLTLSVQASFYHYCHPRDSIGPYSEVEVGFPSEKIEEFMEYAEDADRPTETVYGWVPLDVVAKAIDNHGGINEDS